MKEPIVSVIIPAYNSGEFIKEAIDSVLAQKDVDLEIIIVDDGSEDNTKDIVEGYPTCRYFYKENGGPASARNFGIQMAKGKYLAFLDADDVWLQGKLDAQVKAMEKEPENGLVYTFSVNFVKEIKEVDLSTFPPFNKAHNGRCFKDLFWHNFIRASTVLVRKDCVDICGVFNEDEDFFAVEDYDMWLRIAKIFNLVCVPKVKVAYRGHNKGISKDIDRSCQNEKNVLLAACARWPKLEQDIGMPFKRRLSKLYLDWGSDYLESCNSARARHLFWRALKRDPAYGPLLFNFLKALLPKWIFTKLRQIKRG